MPDWDTGLSSLSRVNRWEVLAGRQRNILLSLASTAWQTLGRHACLKGISGVSWFQLPCREDSGKNNCEKIS